MSLTLRSEKGSALSYSEVDENFSYLESEALRYEIPLACSNETSLITTGSAKVTTRSSCAFTPTRVRGSLTGPATSGTFTVNIKVDGVSMLSRKITFTAGAKTSTTATLQPIISASLIADDAEITVDVDDAGSGDAFGLKVSIVGTRIP